MTIQKAEIQIGRVKRTANQRKKLYTQFTNSEMKLLRSKVSKINTNNIKLSRHLINKKAITYSMNDIKNTIKNCDIIEYNVTKNRDNYYDKRVVLRGKDVIATDKGIMNLCVVVSLKTNDIITVYYNTALDRVHHSVYMDRYDANLKIIL